MSKASNVSAAVITVSDTRTIDNDGSGARLAEHIETLGFEVSERRIVTDDRELIEAALREMVNEGFALICTTGGTGIGPRDVTPEATKAVVDYTVPGLGETMRSETRKFTKFSILSRATAGVSRGSLIINFPGSEKGVAECFEAIMDIIPHAISQVTGDTRH